jgi:hypothetical protein
MTEDAKKQDQLLETTDCLEAVGTLKFNKNLFFFIIFFCLLILQGIFWLTPSEYVDMPGADMEKDAAPVTAMLLQLAAPASTRLGEAGPAEKNMKVEKKSAKIEKAAQALTADANTVAQTAEPNAAPLAKIIPPVNIKFQFSQLSWLIKLCNFLLIVCSVIYSLTLLFCMKVSLVGRLGGIRHITKAVFISFFMVVLILPWQIIFKGVIVGAIYTPAELLDAWNGFNDTASVSNMVMFLRFTGLWLVVVILLFWSQLKSMRWSRNTLKRLGIIA